MNKNPVGKVYINIRKLINDYEESLETKIRKQDLAMFIIKKGTPKARWTQMNRKIKETSPYELTLTEAYNLARFMELSFTDFVEKYCKAI